MKIHGLMRGGRKLEGATQNRRCVFFFRSFVLLGLICFAYHALLSLGQTWTNRSRSNGDEIPSTMRLTRPDRKLIGAIIAAARLANGGTKPPPLTEEELRQWDLANPCRSRLGLQPLYARRNYATEVQDNFMLGVVLQEYAKLHRICRERVGNLKEYFLARNSSIPGCKFAIADYTDGGGLGNKILAVTNTVLYSILTQRIVLVPASTLVPALMCEPFPGSSWVLEDAGDGGAHSSFPVPPFKPAHVGLWEFHDAVYEELDDAKFPTIKGGIRTPVPVSSIYSASMTAYQYQPDSRFFCDTEQERFTGVTWLYFTGCIYIIPRFFALPSLRPTLEALFPDRLALTHIVRSVMLPEDLVWERIVKSYESHLETADRRVGVQVRYRRNVEEYQKMNAVINDRLTKCAVDNGVLPSALHGNATDGQLSGDSRVVTLFIASLFTGFANELAESYLPYLKSGGETVNVVQLSSETRQKYGLDIDRQSLLEIMMLSFSDDIFVTPLSTFGGLAQAYGALVPWIVDYRPPGSQHGPCERGQTVDLCYQEAHFWYSCPHDADVNEKLISDVVPYIRNCLEIDSQPNIPPGFQLITAFPPTSEQLQQA